MIIKALRKKARHALIVLADHRWWPFYIQRCFMQPKTRAYLSSLMALTRPVASNIQKSAEEVKKHSVALKQSGISHLGTLLNNQQCIELKNYFSKLSVFDPYNPKAPVSLPNSQDRNPESHIAHHHALDVVTAPYLLEIANNPHILDIASAFLGCKPTLGYLAVWWSYHTENGAQHAEQFHRDVDDWRFLKLFIYITDVDAQSGPHIYVANSSISEKLREIRRFDDVEVAALFGQNNVMQLTGQAGKAFLEDTFGIHKGQPVQLGNRLIFQAVYSMFQLPYGPKNPVIKKSELSNISTYKFDPWVNRLYIFP